MQDFGTKADNSPPPGGQLSAAEFNNLATENENAVLRSGQTLSGASETQLAQSLFLHGVKSEGFQDSGAANVYVATPISGTNGVLLPPDYANMNGAVITFKAAFSNSAASTLNIGQTTGTLIGAKAIRTQEDLALPSGAIIAGQHVQVIYNAAFDGGAGAWELLPWSLKPVLTVIAATGTFNAPTGSLYHLVRQVGGGGGGAGCTGGAGSSAGGGGGSGGYSEKLFTAAQVGASQAVTIGSAGAPGNAAANGGNGGATTFGALLSTGGGNGGTAGVSGAVIALSGSGGAGGAATGGDVNIPGEFGGVGFIMGSTNGGLSGFGAGNPFSSRAPQSGPVSAGVTSSGRGGGGSGGACTSVSQTGGGGTAGLVVVLSFCVR